MGVLLAGCTPQPPDSYEIVKVCKGPFMRHSKEMVIQRKMDGKLFYKTAEGRIVAIAENVKLKDVCK